MSVHTWWTRGVAVALEDTTWSALRQGNGATVTARSSNNFTGWVHFVIPTPGVPTGTNVKAGQALVQFATGSQASIVAIDVYDGIDKIGGNLVKWTGPLQLKTQSIPWDKPIAYGTGISLQLNFTGTGPEAWVQFIGAAIEFSDPPT